MKKKNNLFIKLKLLRMLEFNELKVDTREEI